MSHTVKATTVTSSLATTNICSETPCYLCLSKQREVLVLAFKPPSENGNVSLLVTII